jgi:hypothetical protein
MRAVIEAQQAERGSGAVDARPFYRRMELLSGLAAIG